jgi:acetyl-CoA synthetase (ADP-forming)
MLSGCREVIIGIVHDPTFGPMLMFGLGGIYVEFSKISGLRESLLPKEKPER